jgi:drug/metabolite transporter (DMT)-like permease
LSFFSGSPDSIIAAPSTAVTPPSTAAARLDRVPPSSPEKKPLPEKKPTAPAAPARVDRPFKGIALILMSTVFLGTSDVTAKYLSATLPSIEIAWLRFLVFAIIMLPAMLPGSPFFALRTSRPGFFLGERVGLRRWLATAVGLFGVLIILRPGSNAFHPAALFSIVSALAWASTLIMTRVMSGSERAITTMTYSSIAGLLILCALVPLVWVTPSWHDILFGILIGLASTAGQWIVVLAFRYADASVLAPFSYTQLLWVSILGFLVFGEVPDVWTVTGAGFVVASGLYTAHRERVRRSQLLALQGEPSPNP